MYQNTCCMKLFFRPIVLATLFFTACLLTATASLARQDSTRYPIVLHYYSIGTGTPAYQPLQNFVSTYRKKNKLPALTATRVGGLGREGEYAILFPLKELTAKQQKQFATALSKALPTLKSKNEKGGINMSKNEMFSTEGGRIAPEKLKM
jgi:hypothetical protein